MYKEGDRVYSHLDGYGTCICNAFRFGGGWAVNVQFDRKSKPLFTVSAWLLPVED